MEQLRLQAVVLRGRNVGEADRLITVFTAERGKLELLAKGVRKMKARLVGHLEPFSLIEAELILGRRPRIIGSQVLERLHSEAEDLFSTSLKFFVIEMVDSLFLKQDPHPRVYRGLVEVLRALAQGQDGRLVIIFSYLVINEAGFRPRFDRCVSCSEPRNKFSRFSIPEGGVVCEACRVGGAQAIPAGVLAAFRDRSVGVSTTQFTQLARLVTQFLYYHIGVELKTAPLLRQLKLSRLKQYSGAFQR